MKGTYHSIIVALVIIALSCSKEDIERAPDCSGLIITVDNITNPLACLSFGSITVTASGGFPPYQYSLNGAPGQSTGSFANLSPGTYSVAVVDLKKCTVTKASIVINAPPSSTLSVTATVVGDNKCLTNVGSVTLAGAGGNGTLQYSFNNSPFASTTAFINLAPGLYEAKVKDANGCLITKSVEVPALSSVSFIGFIKPLIDANCTSPSCHGSGSSLPKLLTFSDIKSRAAGIKTRTGNKSMPQGSTLTDDQIKQIACWVDEGALDN